jgi:hypothetical protein
MPCFEVVLVSQELEMKPPSIDRSDRRKLRTVIVAGLKQLPFTLDSNS